MDQPIDDKDAELIRKRYLYRRLILTKKVALPRTSATQLIGPDCAYHLYSQFNPSEEGTTDSSVDPEDEDNGT